MAIVKTTTHVLNRFNTSFCARDHKANQAISIFFSIWVLFHEHSRITGLQGKGEGIQLTPHYHFHLFTDIQTLAGQLLQRLTSAHSQQPDSNLEPLVSKRKSLTTKLRALKSFETNQPNKSNQRLLRPISVLTKNLNRRKKVYIK